MAAIQPFEANVRSEPGAAILDFCGEINADAEGALNAAYIEAEGGNPATVVLNIGQVTYINSTGIALIVGLLARARKARRQVLVYGLSSHYEEIFQITRLSDFMTIHPDEATALQGAGITRG
jgi:anti-anti-sigma factor